MNIIKFFDYLCFMILIAPDKYRGTLSAHQAARIISQNIDASKIIEPMADGGEGTAEIIASSYGWRFVQKGCYVNNLLREVAIDSSAFIGYDCFPEDIPPLSRSSASLAKFINEIYQEYKPLRIYVGVGGTAICDGGEGFLKTLNNGVNWREILIGLIDVKAPLLPLIDGSPSVLTFCPQKGIPNSQFWQVEEKLRKIIKLYGEPFSCYDGAGGGLGYALASVIHSKCYLGAKWLLERKNIPWKKISLIITGEGRYDNQTWDGKVVSELHKFGILHGIKTICLAGCIDPHTHIPKGLTVIDMSKYFPNEKLSESIAKRRLIEASLMLKNTILNGATK